MIILGILIAQIIIAVIVIVVLKNVLNRELVQAALEALAVKKNSEIKALTLTSARPLSVPLHAQLMATIKRIGVVNIEEQLDPSIVGGVVVTIDGQEMDFSIRHRLNMLFKGQS